jgi:hypothetical protein
MKTLKPRTTPRLAAEEALRISTQQAPSQPPAWVGVEDRSTTLNLRLRMTTVVALAKRAREAGLTQKQVVMHALRSAGVEVAPEDLEDRTPRRRGL